MEFLALLALNMPRTKGVDAGFSPSSVSSSHLFQGFFDALSKDGPNFDGVRNRQTLAMAVYLVSHVSLFSLCEVEHKSNPLCSQHHVTAATFICQTRECSKG